MTEKIAVYTAIFGAYDDPVPIRQPDPDVDYLLFADSTVKAAPPPWQLRTVPAVFADPQRDARRLKALAHLFLPEEYTVSVWVDGNCRIEHIRADAILQLSARPISRYRRMPSALASLPRVKPCWRTGFTTRRGALPGR